MSNASDAAHLSSQDTPIQQLPVAHKKVQLRQQNREIGEKIEYEYSLSPVTSRVLAARGFVPGADLQNYLVPTLKNGMPHPSQMKNLEDAVECIFEHSQNGGSIAIACDFDVDGLSGGSLFHAFLKACNVQSKVYVPNRFSEGYGLNDRIINDAKKEGFDLLVTIDFGTTNVKELELARSIGLKTIVVDHHHVEENPPCDIFVNPQQDGCSFADGILCAAGLTWFLIALLAKKFPKKSAALHPKKYLDIACLGTICDMVPLHGPNRIIARRGLECLAETKRPGLVALKELISARHNLSCSHVSFGIGPRINAAGRMLSGELVVELLTTSDTKKAEKIAKKLHRLNKQRQEAEEGVKKDAFLQVEKQGRIIGKVPDGIVAWGKHFHTGVIGIVAQRMVERFYRPTAILGYDSGAYKGSVRGIKGISVVEILKEVNEYLMQYGGHAGAGGFSIEEDKVEDFAKAFSEVSAKHIASVERSPIVHADTESSLSELTPAIVRELKRFEPLGIGNPSPQILLRELTVKEVKLLKGAHLKAILSDGKRTIAGLMWKKTEHPALKVGNIVTVTGKVDLNTYFGNTEMQMNLQAVE